MRKLVFSVMVSIIFLGGISPRVVFSQETPTPAPAFDFKRAYDDFVFTYDTYRTEHSQYELARSQYLQSKTLAAKAKAQEETYQMLSARDESVKAYLTMLRMRMSESVGIPHDRRELLYSRVDTEVAWYDDHKNSLSSAATLEDQVVDSNKAKKRYEDITSLLVYEILAEVAIGKEYVLWQKENILLGQVRDKVGEIRSNGDLDTQQMERDILEIENRLARSEGKHADVQKLLSDLEKQSGRDKIYTTIQFRLGESIQYLKEANNYLLQIISKIKFG